MQLRELGNTKFVQGGRAANAKLARIAKSIARAQVRKNPLYKKLVETPKTEQKIFDILENSHLKGQQIIRDFVQDTIPIDRVLVTQIPMNSKECLIDWTIHRRIPA
jgi:anion-transporting  ArsA/GET3 family ATPase